MIEVVDRCPTAIVPDAGRILIFHPVVKRGLTNHQAAKVLADVATREGVPVAALTSRNSTRRVSRARWRVWRELVDTYAASTTEAGLATGHDHTTVMYGLKRLAEL